MEGLSSDGADNLLDADVEEDQDGDAQDQVREPSAAELAGNAQVQEPEERDGEKRHEQGAEGGVYDHDGDRLVEGEEQHGGEGDPDEKGPEEDALLGEVPLALLVFRHPADRPDEVPEEVGAAVPGAGDGAGGRGPEAYEEEPARHGAEAFPDGVGEGDQALLSAYAPPVGEEEFCAYDQHRHH